MAEIHPLNITVHNAIEFEQSYAILKAAIRGGYIEEYCKYNSLETHEFNDSQLIQIMYCLRAERFVRCNEAFGLGIEYNEIGILGVDFIETAICTLDFNSSDISVPIIRSNDYERLAVHAKAAQKVLTFYFQDRIKPILEELAKTSKLDSGLFVMQDFMNDKSVIELITDINVFLVKCI